MPFIERDPWREQYFAGVPCPAGVVVPMDDGDAWVLYPRHRWVYNKLAVCETQGLPHGPHGTDPPSFPVFSKPIYNMKGMGAGSRVIANAADYEAVQEPGHMWMPLLSGEHVSSDAVVIDGRAAWWRHAVGRAIGGGMFDYWTVEAAPRSGLEARLGAWLSAHLARHTGVVNVESIGGAIIECHLRLSDQWPDLYGAGWVAAVARLYAEGRWDFPDGGRRDGFSVVLFGAHGFRYARPPAAAVAEAKAWPHVSSVQITFHADRPPEAHSMPPGGFRLAIVNGWDLEAGRAARERLARAFRPAPAPPGRPPGRPGILAESEASA